MEDASPGSGGPRLTPEQHQAFDDARERGRKILGAAKVATFNGWSIGIFAPITILFGLKSPVVLLLGVGMAVVARNEFRGRAMLRRFDPAGPRLLGRNQLGFMALIVLYCVWSIIRARLVPSTELAELEQVLGSSGELQDLVQTITVAVYVGVIAATALFQGLNARYYFQRGPMVEAYLDETPGWVVEMQRSASVD